MYFITEYLLTQHCWIILIKKITVLHRTGLVIQVIGIYLKMGHLELKFKPSLYKIMKYNMFCLCECIEIKMLSRHRNASTCKLFPSIDYIHNT